MIESAQSCIESLARKNLFAADGLRRAGGMLHDRLGAALLGDFATGLGRQATELHALMHFDSTDRLSTSGRSHAWRDVELAFGSGDVTILKKVIRGIEELEEAYVFAGVEYCMAEFRELLVRHELFVDSTRRRVASLRESLIAHVGIRHREAAM